jgi:hypothetical protein
MKQRTIELLRYCGMKFTLHPDCPRSAEWNRLCKVYSQKACWRKLEELDSRGYIEVGTSVYSAWLTSKGKRVLEETNHGTN